VTPETESWLDALGRRLPRHAAVLRALVAAAEREPRIRTVMVGCSIGRGVADELSDIDAHMCVTDAAWPQIVDDVVMIARAAADPLETLVHCLPDVPAEKHRHVFVQYADGVQLSLVVQPASAQTRRGRAPDVVALHDPDDRLGIVVEPGEATVSSEELREWSVLAWQALDDVVKYMRRASPWEALERLHAARTYLWRLWAAAEGVRSPGYGLTSVLDTPGARLPPHIEETVPALSHDAITSAARACASLLTAVAGAGSGMAPFVTAKLATLGTDAR
jgi:hypothetical protein